MYLSETIYKSFRRNKFYSYSVLQLFPNYGQVAKSQIFVCSNFSENWVETHFSDVQKPNRRNVGVQLGHQYHFRHFIEL